MADKTNKWLNVKIPVPIQWIGLIWLGYLAGNTLLTVMGKM
jgi:hypothetical protein